MGRPKGSKNKAEESDIQVVDKPVETVNKPQFKEGLTLRDQMVPEPKERVRQYSNNKDHKGEGEPLCFGCNHRADMHYIEHRWTEEKLGKNLQGDIGTIEIQKRRPMYDGARPCQHACLCKAYA